MLTRCCSRNSRDFGVVIGAPHILAYHIRSDIGHKKRNQPFHHFQVAHPAHTRYDTHTPCICWRPGPTCAEFNFYSVTAVWPPPPATFVWPSPRSAPQPVHWICFLVPS